MTTERRMSAFPVQGGPDDLVGRVVEVLPIGSAGVTLISATDTPRHAVASDHSISTILVPLGELDYFNVRRLTNAAATHMVGTHRSVTVDLSAVSFCDSSIGSLLNWVGDLPDELDVTVVIGPAVEHVLSLLTGELGSAPSRAAPTDASQPLGDRAG